MAKQTPWDLRCRGYRASINAMDTQVVRQAMGLFLKALEARHGAGQKSLRLGSVEREAMRQWSAMLRDPQRSGSAGSKAVAPPVKSSSIGSGDAISVADSLAAARRKLGGGDGKPPTLTASANPVTTPIPEYHAQKVAIPAAELLPTEGSTKEEQISSLERMAAEWAPARDLETLRPTLVFSTGNPQAQLMLVGEAPGAEEELRREPFVGPAGNLLDKILKAMGLDRQSVYISNICKFRPLVQRQSSNNRKPTTEEMQVCLPFILTEIEVVKPKLIVALGATAAEGLLGLTDPVGRLRARVHTFGETPAIVTYHPSYLLRNQALGEKRKVWEDMMLAMETMGMPVSERQRSFFLKA